MEENNFFNKLCWVCLAEESNMLSLANKDKKVEIDNMKDPVSLYDLLSYVINSQIFYVNGPYLICNNCKIQACAAYKFKKRCDVSSNIFQKCGLTPCTDDVYCSLDKISIYDNPEDVKQLSEDTILLSEETTDVKHEIKTETELEDIQEEIPYENNTMFETIEVDSICINDSGENEKDLMINQEELIDKNVIEIEDKPTKPLNTKIPHTSLPNSDKFSNDTLQQEGVGSLVITQVFSIRDEIEFKSSVKKKRSEDKCFFCKNRVRNFARHLLRHHALERDVKAIRLTPVGSKERKRLFTVLRKKGNYLCNANDFKPMKNSKTVENLDKYMACIKCLGYYSRKYLGRHKKTCLGKQDYIKGYLGPDNFLLNNFKIDEQLVKDVFPIMRNDKISLGAQRDVLICTFGSYYLKIHKGLRSIYIVSRKMRELSKLLFEIQKLKPSIKHLFEALSPEYYPTIVDATKIIGQYNETTNSFNSPTFVLNIGSSLNRCFDIALNCTQNTEGIDDTVKSNLKKIQEIFLLNWKEDISSQAISSLNSRWEDVTLVSLASDLKILIDHVTTKANYAYSRLLSNQNQEDYVELMETVYCRMALLNRKHYLILQKLSWGDYENIQDYNNEASTELTSVSENILLQNFMRLYLMDKCGLSVPIYISTDVYTHINILNELKCNLTGISQNYLFAYPNSSSLLFGNNTLMKNAKTCGTRNPLALICAQFKNNIQLLSQLFFLKETEIESLRQFFNHKIGINEKVFHSTDHIDQMIKLSRRLLKEKNTAIECFDVTDVSLAESEPKAKESDEQPSLLDKEQSETKVTSDTLQTNILEETVGCIAKISDGTKPKIQRTPWTLEQKKVVMTFFKKHIKLKNPPKRRECEELIDLHPDLLKNKDWLKIKVFIQNVYVKGLPKDL